MQVIVPMAGIGKRFQQAGYTVPKPLIEVEGKPIIEHIVDCFSEADRFVFICHADHLNQPSYGLRQTLSRCCPAGEIVAITGHDGGPVQTVCAGAAAIDPNLPTLVTYCDYAVLFDGTRLRTHLARYAPDGCVLTYTGFHPHMLREVRYAYVWPENDYVTAIQEKRPYTETPMREHASAGAYYFSSGGMMLDYMKKTLEQGPVVNGEYYVSMVYTHLLSENRCVTYFDVDYFMQWGTPEDLAEYRYFSDMFRLLVAGTPVRPRHGGTTLLPMAGAGKRFQDAGFRNPKPLIPVSGRAMAAQAVADLPAAEQTVIVARTDQLDVDRVRPALEAVAGSIDLVQLTALTDGQARTCWQAADRFADDQPLTIGACDNGMIYDGRAFEDALAGAAGDVWVWGIRGYPGAVRKPEAYGWIAAEADGSVTRVAVKEPLGDVRRDPIVIGTFTFRRAQDFRRAADRLFARQGTVNGEYYVDSLVNDCIALGLRVKLFEVDSYLCWGTPDDWRRFVYWQSCFHCWASHPYALTSDADVEPAAAPVPLSAQALLDAGSVA